MFHLDQSTAFSIENNNRKGIKNPEHTNDLIGIFGQILIMQFHDYWILILVKKVPCSQRN